MQIWKRITIKDKDKNIEQVSKALTNYLYTFGPVAKIYSKYNITPEDRKELEQHTVNRIAGLLMLYSVRDFDRINDIANKYNFTYNMLEEISPEIEAYINK